jgi:hypothetical protein
VSDMNRGGVRMSRIKDVETIVRGLRETMDLVNVEVEKFHITDELFLLV